VPELDRVLVDYELPRRPVGQVGEAAGDLGREPEDVQRSRSGDLDAPAMPPGDGSRGEIVVGRQRRLEEITVPGVIVQASGDPSNPSLVKQSVERDIDRLPGAQIGEVGLREHPTPALAVDSCNYLVFYSLRHYLPRFVVRNIWHYFLQTSVSESTCSFFVMTASDAFWIGVTRSGIPLYGTEAHAGAGSVRRFRLGIDMGVTIGKRFCRAVLRLVVGCVSELTGPVEVDDDRSMEE